MRLPRIYGLIGLLLLSILQTACHTLIDSDKQAIPTVNWQYECVGEFEFMLPGLVGMPLPSWSEVIGKRSRSYAFLPASTFNRDNLFIGPRDHQDSSTTHAWGSEQVIDGFMLFPGPTMTADEFPVLKSGMEKILLDIKADLIASFHSMKADQLQLVQGKDATSFLWQDSVNSRR